MARKKKTADPPPFDANAYWAELGQFWADVQEAINGMSDEERHDYFEALDALLAGPVDDDAASPKE